MNTLSIKNLSKSYKNISVINNLSLEFKNGVVGILGPNGAGKTTLLKLIIGLTQKNKGEILFNNIPCNSKKEISEYIGYLPQHFSIYEDLKVFEVLEYICLLKNIKNDNITKYIENILDITNLLPHKDKKIKELSGGMLRRVGLCQALIGDPPILIIDEPTTGLDPANRLSFRNLINDLAQNRIIILTTHIVEDVAATCDSICVINKGNLLFNGSISKLKEKVKNNIYEVKLNLKEFETFKKNERIISYKREDEFLIVRYISVDKILKDSKKVEENIEDAYIYLIGEENE